MQTVRVTQPEEAQPQPLPAPQPQVRRRGSARIVLLFVLVSAIGGLVARTVFKSRAAATAAAAASASAAANRVVPVLTSAVAERDVPIWLDGLGNVSAFYTVTVKPQVDGRIDKVLFKEGQHVKKGDVLVQIDPRPFAIQLQSAQAALARDTAQLKNGQLNLDRYQTLSGEKLIATQQLTDQQATVAQLDAQVRADQAQVASAALSLDYARITSPIDGVTGVRLVDPGNVVHATDPGGLVVVTELDPIAVFFTLPEDDLPAISRAREGKADLGVEARSRDGDALLGEGKLSVIDNEINQATATIRLKAIFDNPKQLLWPNQFVKARLRLGTRERALTMPAAVVQRGPQGTFAYVVGPDSTVTAQPIEIEVIQGETAIVTKGVKPGDQVVVEGQAQLRPGAKVATKPATSASPSSSQSPSTSSSAPTSPSPSASGHHRGAPP
jgi:multidrug efflux system membrane fusion protein